MDETHPIVIKHPATNLGENVTNGSLECDLDVDAALCTRLDKEQALILRPLLPFLCLHLPPLARQVILVADEDARQVRVCVCTHVGEPRARVFETWQPVSASAELRGRRRENNNRKTHWAAKSRHRRADIPRHRGSRNA
jgi:hypothetical protein